MHEWLCKDVVLKNESQAQNIVCSKNPHSVLYKTNANSGIYDLCLKITH